MQPMNRRILHIAVPSILSNVTVPLLALADTTVVGHLGAVAYIGAVALGAMLFNMAYWLFGFLRMGTGGLTAQAYGAGQKAEAVRVLFRSLALAAGVGVLLIALQGPVLHVAFRYVSATPDVASQAAVYFRILIWGAPAVLGLYSFTGWFLGMQNARWPMLIALVQNVLNVATSLFLVYVLGWKVDGVATGTLVAQYAGLIMAWRVFRRRFRVSLRAVGWREVFAPRALGRFFRINRDIFLRTLCLVCVSTYFTSAGSAQGELVLAANALLMQFFILFSYVMDGFAYAGEALGGRYCGAGERHSFERMARCLFVWGAGLAAAFTLAYLCGGPLLLALLTDSRAVRAEAASFLPFACAIPAVSMAAFLFDGLFVGTTSTRQMLLSMLVASAAFFVVVWAMPCDNAWLWAAFLVYLGGRSVMQALLYPRVRRKIGRAGGIR